MSIATVSSRPATHQMNIGARSPALDQPSSHIAGQEAYVTNTGNRMSPQSNDSEEGHAVIAPVSPLDIPAASEALPAATNVPLAANEAFAVCDGTPTAANDATILRDVRRMILVQEALHESRTNQMHCDAEIEKLEQEEKQATQRLTHSRRVLEDMRIRLTVAQSAFQHAQQNYDEVAGRLAEARYGLQSRASLVERLQHYCNHKENQIGALISASVDNQDLSFVDGILRGDSV